MDWLKAVRELPTCQCAVQHQPETPRYARARTKLRYVLERGTYLGVRQSQLHPQAMEIAVWAPPGHGRGAGYYCCFRVFLDQDHVDFTLLFCFYDGTEGSPGFKSVGSARTFATSNGFRSVDHENHH